MGYYGGYYFGYGQSTASVERRHRLPHPERELRAEDRDSWPTVAPRPSTTTSIAEPGLPRPAQSGQAGRFRAGAFAARLCIGAPSTRPAWWRTPWRRRVSTSATASRLAATVDAQTQATLYQYANYAQRWERQAGRGTPRTPSTSPAHSREPGPPPTANACLLTRDDVYATKQVDTYWQWVDNVSLNLLRAVTVNGKPGAERLDTRTFGDVSPGRWSTTATGST
jgi:hypothetical protein